MTANSIDGILGDGLHRQQVRVYYEDTDFSGVVYHASYLRFMERGRLLTPQAFKHLGLAEPARDASQIGLFGEGEDE